MNERQKRFVKEYLTDLNATRAAISAGYSAKTAKQIGSRLLTHVDVCAAIQNSLEKTNQKLDISREKVLGELSKLAFSNMLDYIHPDQNGMAYVDLSKLTREQAAAIQEITTEEFTVGESDEEEARVVTKVKFKLADKRGSLELLGKYLKLFNPENAPGEETTVNAIQIQIVHVGAAAHDPNTLTAKASRSLPAG